MAIRDIVTRGYGSWGSIPEVVTHGYSIAEVTTPDAEGIEWTLPGALIHYTVPDSRIHYTMTTEGSG